MTFSRSSSAVYFTDQDIHPVWNEVIVLEGSGSDAAMEGSVLSVRVRCTPYMLQINNVMGWPRYHQTSGAQILNKNLLVDTLIGAGVLQIQVTCAYAV